MDSQKLNSSIIEYLKKGGRITLLKERHHRQIIVPKTPLKIPEHKPRIVKKIWFMGKMFLRRYY
jgi:hypothetical protein